MTIYEAPAKVNLSLLVSPPQPDGYHPLQSLVQTVEWCDLLKVQRGEGKDTLETVIEDNLVNRSLQAVRDIASVPPLRMVLVKEIPMAAGLGGGSSDAAAALLAASDFGEVSRSMLTAAAPRVGADVSLFLVGGTLLMEGLGERLTQVEAATDFALAVVVPEFGLSTADVYRRWDSLEGPDGTPISEDRLPPSLRGRMPMRNDLLPAALDLDPRLGDFMADVRSVWGTDVCLTGSGTACFGYFATLDEATDGAVAVSHLAATVRGVELRPVGVRQQTA